MGCADGWFYSFPWSVPFHISSKGIPVFLPQLYRIPLWTMSSDLILTKVLVSHFLPKGKSLTPIRALTQDRSDWKSCRYRWDDGEFVPATACRVVFSPVCTSRTVSTCHITFPFILDSLAFHIVAYCVTKKAKKWFVWVGDPKAKAPYIAWNREKPLGLGILDWEGPYLQILSTNASTACDSVQKYLRSQMTVHFGGGQGLVWCHLRVFMPKWRGWGDVCLDLATLVGPV